MLEPLNLPGLFITATDTGVGKTVIASAIAGWLHRHGHRVGVCKIAATGCVLRDDRLISEDAEFLAEASGSRFDLETICPIRYAEPLAPAVAAGRTGVPLDWSLLQASLDTMASQSDVMIVEGVGGVMVPMDDRHTVLDVARWLGVPAVVVARPGLGTINHTLLTVNALRAAGVAVTALVFNRYPVGRAGVAEETNPAVIGHWLMGGEKNSKRPTLCFAPDEPFEPPNLPEGVITALQHFDWMKLAHGSRI